MEDKISYKNAGVDIQLGNKFIKDISKNVESTFNKNVIGGIGFFSGAYSLPTGYKEPVLLSATDGVGTKLRIAIESNRFNSIGIDLVAMCANDIICNFGTPMFFLDYYATGKLIIKNAKDILSGIAKACIEAECSLIGGETAEMPTMYKNKDFDLAGFIVGIAEKKDIDRTRKIKNGQVIMAFPSSGLHSNGYSLVAKLFFDKLEMKLDTIFDNKPLVETLLEPTKIYVKDFINNKDKIQALAHITGGGLIENIPRIIPDGFSAIIQKNLIKSKPIFDFIGKYISEDEMFLVFNMGIGMAIIVNSEDVNEISKNSNAYIIGEIKKGNKKIQIIN